MALEGFQGRLGELHGTATAFGFGSGEYRAALRRRQRAPHLQRSGFEVNVAPLEAEQLSLAKPSVNGENIEGFEPVVPNCFEQHLHLFCGQRSYLLLPDLWWPDRFGGVARDEAVGESLLECLVKGDVDILNGAWREPSLYLIAVEAAHVGRRHVLELEIAQSR